MNEHQLRVSMAIYHLVELDSMEEAALVLAEAIRLKAEQQRRQRSKEADVRTRSESEI